ncbi:MAG: MATE family efflux transporter [Dehalococcoidales bacterium]|nr:MATE family efflux transporter [Dehalococcoidales bacterium]
MQPNTPGNRKFTAGDNWVTGSILRNLLRLSWPMIIGNMVNMLGPTVDMIWVGRLGSAAIAAVGVSGTAVMLAQSSLMGLFTGMRAMVARFVGANDDEQANHIAQQAIVIGAGSSIVMAVIGIFLSEQILELLGVGDDVIAEGASYMRIQFVGMTAMAFRTMAEGIMQAAGDARTPMKIAVGFRVVHVALAPALIFGFWFIPAMGVNGAAITNVVSQSAGTILAFWYLMSGRTRLKLSLKGFRIDYNTIWRIVRIGIPASVMGVEQNLRNMIFIRFMAPFGTVAMAAHTVLSRIEMILFMPAFGLGMAAGVLTGQNLGAGQPERAEKSGWTAVGIIEAFVAIVCVLLFIWTDVPVKIFTSDPELIEVSVTFIRIALIGYLFMGMGAVFQQCITSAGDTVIPMIIGIISGWLMQLPLAYFLPKVGDMGVIGIRWAVVIPMAVTSVTYLVYFRLGRWKRKKV